MTAHQLPHGQTVSRAERLHLLVTTLQSSELMREDIGSLLKVGPSAVRKYVQDLDGVIEIARFVDGTSTFLGYPVYRLAMTLEQAEEYLASLATAPVARRSKPSMSALSVAARDPSRHFHILADDTHYAIRVSRSPVARDPLVAALFGPRAVEMRA